MRLSLACVFALSVLLLPAPTMASHEDWHQPCGCVAASLGFTINCNARAFITEAFNALSSCTTCGAGSACYRNYIIVQVRACMSGG